MNVDRAITGELEPGSCPHMAVLLKSAHQLPRALASFYALGATRLLDGPSVLDRIADVSPFHDGVLMPAGEDYAVLPRAEVAV